LPPLDVDPRWYDGFFEGEWLDFLARERDGERTAAEVDFIVDKLALEPRAPVLDLACGHGRHSLELARRGFRVTGVDLSPRSLELAREAAASEGLEVDFVQSDMREIDFDAEFDGAINLFTAFGYFESDDEDRDVVRRIARALRPGGGFLIDTLNALGLAKRYQPRRWEHAAEGVIMLDDHEWDVLAGRNRASWTFIKPDGSRSELRHIVRTYAPWELAALIASAGLAVEAGWGDFEGAPLTHESWRLILLARRT
jgi:SAM-dependent methyltransferase